LETNKNILGLVVFGYFRQIVLLICCIARSCNWHDVTVCSDRLAAKPYLLSQQTMIIARWYVTKHSSTLSVIFQTFGMLCAN